MSGLFGQDARWFMRTNNPFQSTGDFLSFDANDGAEFGWLSADIHARWGIGTTPPALVPASSFEASYGVASANATAPSVSIGNVTITEGNSGTKVATFTVTRTGGPGAFTVNYATANGTATTADNDYVARSGTLSFGTNVNSQTISITIRGDTKVENNETFFVNLSRASNGVTISDSQAVGTIATDDQSRGTISINDVSITEGNGGAKVATFTVNRSGGTGAFSVNYATANGTATAADGDYAARSGVLSFGSSVNSQTVSVTINGDTKVEGNETFFINLSGPTNGAVIGDGQGIGTIVNDDVSTGNISINDVSITEGNNGTKLATFTATRTGGTAAFNVNYATADSTATVADGDYTGRSGVLSFGSGVNSQTISVTINGDIKPEANETFLVNLSGATNGAVIQDGQGVGTIVNDETTPAAISINDVSITEGDSGSKIATFTVARTGGSGAFTVNYGTADSSATVGDNDYVARSGTLSFGSNVNSQTISVTVNGDTKLESNESFFVNLSNASNGVVISDSRGVGTIANNDASSSGGTYDIQISYVGDARFGAVFEAAAARWEKAIVGDVPDISVAGIGLIDDLRIDALVVPIDGAGGILGQAGPDGLRPGTLLPYHGNMEFDAADVEQMYNNGTLLGVISHEIGHILGLGTLWDLKGLKSGAFSYTGADALAEYRILSGNSAATSIPLETTGGAGTAGSHWSEAVFGSELMTGYANGSLPMSRMTIASMEDLGYVVNLSAADPYSLPSSLVALKAANDDFSLTSSLVGLKAADDYFGLV
jgi:aspartate 1-decarboxylase